jgi:hypothetical protein
LQLEWSGVQFAPGTAFGLVLHIAESVGGCPYRCPSSYHFSLWVSLPSLRVHFFVSAQWIPGGRQAVVVAYIYSLQTQPPYLATCVYHAGPRCTPSSEQQASVTMSLLTLDDCCDLGTARQEAASKMCKLALLLVLCVFFEPANAFLGKFDLDCFIRL